MGLWDGYTGGIEGGVIGWVLQRKGGLCLWVGMQVPWGKYMNRKMGFAFGWVHSRNVDFAFGWVHS